ncbi:MAG: alpha/beta fold hydrolase [Rudaea sp.]|uniref:alpha/beta fold hydrolase n=1 Tax=unclassified Rudaea TaxID=2627037 RepID=UPI0010F825F6|nr:MULTISPECIES: alpha/beta fold hydrolase [unclassified Rudaea]MBN8888201.1 alpha/beta fold hydrolase [Rudaea sp.]
MIRRCLSVVPALAALFFCLSAHADTWPAPVEGDYVIKDFRFASGETLPELRLHYRTLGNIHKDKSGKVDNAVLIMHGTGGAGTQFVNERFAGQLFGPGQPLDAAKYFIVLPDGIGHGKSSKPSDGLRMKFPRYDYDDMVKADYRLLTEKLKVNHLRLVMGTSMGGMHTWVWGETYPDFMDALMPLASLPVEIAGRNRMFRRMFMDAIRNDPEWNNGDYTKQPRGLADALHILMIMGSVPLQWQKEYPTRDAADKYLEDRIAALMKEDDANDCLYQVDSSRNYNPQPRLAAIKVPLLAVNSADDQINPPELGILEREIKNVANGSAVVLPISDATRGHSSHTWAVLWKNYLVDLLQKSEGAAQRSRSNSK